MRHFLPLLAALTAVTCIAGAFHLPYSYYMLLRCMATATALVLLACRREALPDVGMWLLVMIALLFNPIVKVHLTREVWQVVDPLTGLVFGWLSGRLERPA